MIYIKTPKEIEIMKESGRLLADILYQVSAYTKAGMATIELNDKAEELVKKSGCNPSFKNYKGPDGKRPFPAVLCVSINDEVVHGIPSKERILKSGDVVSIDLGIRYKNLHTDMAITFAVDAIERLNKKTVDMIEITQRALMAGIKTIKDGSFLGDIGFAIQSYVEARGFNVVKKLVGHGIGYSVHEEPDIPNFGKKGKGIQLKNGMTLAIEPMVTEENADVFLDKDGWTWKTKDGFLAAHFEHTVVVTKFGAEILTCLTQTKFGSII
ncbi:MAG: type I methionyl aminopeptidase [Patescibacteria group bacterium]